MKLLVDRDSRTPAFRQIAEWYRTAIVAGEIPLGSRMPTIRELATLCKVARQTAMDAYDLLKEWGFVEAHVGRGTRVARELPTDETAALAGLVASGPMTDFEKLSQSGGLRSLATAVPDPAFFRADELLAELGELRDGSPWAFYYAPPAGVPELRHQIALRLRADGVQAEERQILVTNGATHALALLVDELCRPGDRVGIEEPGFLGMPAFFQSRGLEVVRIPTSPEGLDLSAFADAAVKVAIVCPSFGSATGHLMPADRRQEMVMLAARKGVTLIEDAHYRPLSFKRQPPPLMASGSPTVIHVDSFSGYLAPGLRTGWIVADPHLISRLERRVRVNGASGTAFTQTAIAAYLGRGHLEAHLTRTLPRYRERRDALVSALKFDWPREVSWTCPEGGLSSWIELPSGRDWSGLYEEALAKGVPFAPGSLFGAGEHCLRLSYGVQRPEAIHEAAMILGRIVGDRLAR